MFALVLFCKLAIAMAPPRSMRCSYLTRLIGRQGVKRLWLNNLALILSARIVIAAIQTLKSRSFSIKKKPMKYWLGFLKGSYAIDWKTTAASKMDCKNGFPRLVETVWSCQNIECALTELFNIGWPCSRVLWLESI